jgi:GT2 family glycosyltransferase
MSQQSLTFSIVIPTYNRPDRLEKCLQSMTQLDYPRDRFEVIVVDDGSAQPMESVAVPFQSHLNLTVIRQVNSGPAKARNTGASHAQGEYIAFTDDDCTLDRQWLRALETCFKAHPQALVGGRTINALPDNVFSTASQLLIDYIYSYYNAPASSANFLASNNFAMPREQFQAVGGFDVNFPLAAGEDREFCDRWLHHGYAIVYAPEVTIHHAHHLSLKSFWRQHFNYGRGAFCFHQTRSVRTDEGLRVEPLTFYWNLIRFPFVQSSSSSPFVLTALLFLSQVANVLGFSWERWQYSQPSLTPVKE